MRYLLLSSLLLLGMGTSSTASQKPIVIAVIDTGFTQNEGYTQPNLCKFGHADLTSADHKTNTVPLDNNGHGTHITYTISNMLSGLPRSSYCLVILKYWTDGITEQVSIKNTVNALKRAENMGVNFINYSSFGAHPDPEEREVIQRLLNSGTVIVSAAGNNGDEIVSESYNNESKFTRFIRRISTLEKEPSLIYPGDYNNKVIVVGNLMPTMIRNPSSNWGSRVDVWEVGTMVLSGGTYMTGTSQATAVHTGKLVRNLIKERN